MPQSKAGGKTVNRTELAGLLAVDLSTVDRWLSRGMPIEKTGGRGKAHKFNSAAVIAWLLAREVEKKAPDDDLVDLEEARTRKTIAEAAQAELDLEARQGELVEIDTVAELIESAFATVRLRLLAVPSKVAPRLAPLRTAAKCRRLLEDEFRSVLDELVDGGLFAANAAARDSDKRNSKRGRKGRGATTSSAG